MIINLKQINLSDSDNIKLDKINYNFDQLVANGGGPMGSTGPIGNQGATGITGAQGYQGTIGAQGNQGDPGANTTAYWKNIAGSGSVPVDTIIPIHNILQNAYPPVVAAGFVSSDAEYGVGQNLQQGQLPYQWIINRKTNFVDNLRFTSSDVSGNYFRFRMENDAQNSINKFTMGFLNPSNTSIIWHAQNHIFIDNTTGASLLTITDSSITYHRDVEFDTPVTVNGQLKIGNANADIDKIVVAADNNGTVTFKGIDELGGVVPYGTIVSILPSVFSNNSNFINTEQVTLNDVNDLLKVGAGRGINDYAGWYICNGKTWVSDSSNLQHITPDLNSFSYTIQDNTDTVSLSSQGLAEHLNSETHLIGGADISMDAYYITPTPNVNFYSVSSTVVTTDTTISSATGTTFKIKKLPQIIYLGDDDCYWQDAGSGQAPITTNSYYISDLNDTVSGSPTAATVRINQQGTSDQFTIRVYAANGYYFDPLPTGVQFVPQQQGYSVVSMQSGGGTYATFIDVTISATQGSDGISRFINWDSSAYAQQIPTFSVNFNRTLTPNNLTGTTVNGVTGTVTSVTGDVTNGFDLTIVLTTNQINGINYRFDNPNIVGINLSSPPTGVTLNVISKTFTGGITEGTMGWNNEITIVAKVQGIQYGTGTTTTINYQVTGGPGVFKQIGNVVMLSGYGQKYPLTNSTDSQPTMKMVNTGSTNVYIRLVESQNAGGTTTTRSYISGSLAHEVTASTIGNTFSPDIYILPAYNGNSSNIKYGNIVYSSGTGYGFYSEYSVCTTTNTASCYLPY
jgi:hypothetical protein